MLKKLIFLPLLFAVFLVAILGVSYVVVPKDQLNGLIGEQLSDTFGLPTTVEGKPRLTFIPYLGVELGPVRIGTSSGTEEAFAEVERMSGRLSVTSIWEGRPALRTLVLDDAKFSLSDVRGRDALGRSSFFRFVSNENSHHIEVNFPERLRYIDINNGSLSFKDANGAEKVFENITGRISGPRQGGRIGVNGSADWFGETLGVDAKLDTGNHYDSRNETAATMALSSKHGSLNLTGQFSYINNATFSGTLQSSISNPASFFELAGFDNALPVVNRKIEVNADAAIQQQSMKLNNLQLSLDEELGEGSALVSYATGMVDVSSTLDFETLTFTSSGTAEQDNDKGFASTLQKMAHQAAKFDLRLSARTAIFEQKPFTDVAIGLVGTHEKMAITVGNATTEENGRISGALEARADNEDTDIAFDLNLENVPLAESLIILGISEPEEIELSGLANFTAKGNAKLDYKANSLAGLDATITGALERGMWNGLRIDQAISTGSADDNADAPSPVELAKGPFLFEKMKGKVHLTKDVVDVQKLTFDVEETFVALRGLATLGQERKYNLLLLAVPSALRKELNLSAEAAKLPDTDINRGFHLTGTSDKPVLARKPAEEVFSQWQDFEAKVQ